MLSSRAEAAMSAFIAGTSSMFATRSSMLTRRRTRVTSRHRRTMEPCAENASSGLSRHAQVGKMSTGSFAHPKTNRSARAITQLVDDQTRLGGSVDEDTHFRPLDDDAHVEPPVAVGLGNDSALVGAGSF